MGQRFNITISDELKQWLSDESKKTGIPQSTIAVIALNEYKERNKDKNK